MGPGLQRASVTMTTDSSSAQAVHSSPGKALSWGVYHSCRRHFPEQQQPRPLSRPLVPPTPGHKADLSDMWNMHYCHPHKGWSSHS